MQVACNATGRGLIMAEWIWSPEYMYSQYGCRCGLPSSGVDEETLANLIHSTSVAHFGGLDPRVAPIIARAVAGWLKGEER